MQNGVIGHTGLIGGIIAKNTPRDTLFFNSKNIHEIAYHQFDMLYCAGISGAKWKANQDPHVDQVAIDNLISNLRLCTAKTTVLISTIDVHDESPGNFYGAHRAAAEKEISNLRNLGSVRIARLPAVFGPGLKKNILFDLLSGDHQKISQINPESSYQWYPLRRLWLDLKKLNWYGGFMNMYPPTIKTSVIANAFFPEAKLGSTLKLGDPVIYKRSPSHYFRITRCDVLGEMAQWIVQERS